MAFIYTLAAHEPDLALAQAELRALTGAEATGRLAQSTCACDISRSVYVEACGELIAEAASLEQLCGQVLEHELGAPGFRVEVRRLGKVEGPGSQEVACQVATVLRGDPDLEQPRARFLVVATPARWQLARVISWTDRGYHRQEARPVNFSFSLHIRHARALVNLVAAPGDRLLDPCCGIGTCVVEALHMGVEARGVDINRHAVRMARQNLAFFGLPECIEHGDARTVAGLYDAAVIDLPYGRTSHPEPGLYAGIVNNAARRVFRMAVVAAEPLDSLAGELGLRVLGEAVVAKGQLRRHFTVLSGLRAET